MVQFYLRTSDIDNVYYTTANISDKPTIATNDPINGVSNTTRTKMTFKNVNLMSILGRKWYNQDTFKIKLNNVQCINEEGGNIIDTTSPPQLRTSNLYMSGLNFENSPNTQLIGVVSNYDPNLEEPIRMYFHRGDLGDYEFYFYDNQIEGYDGDEFFATFLLPALTNGFINYPDFKIVRIDRTPVGALPVLIGKVIRFTYASMVGGTQFVYTKIEYPNNDGLARIPAGNVNNYVGLQPLNKTNQWFNIKKDDTMEDDRNYGIELTFTKPKEGYLVDITLELRDILTNKLQPIVAEPNNKVYPSFVFTFEIN
jgi:hypothetical protein